MCRTMPSTGSASAAKLRLVQNDEMAAMFPWWVVTGDGEPDAHRVRALAWVEGSYAKVAATARHPRGDDAERLLGLVRRCIDEGPVDPWETPVEFEAWLRGLLRGCSCALALEQRPDA